MTAPICGVRYCHHDTGDHDEQGTCLYAELCGCTGYVPAELPEILAFIEARLVEDEQVATAVGRGHRRWLVHLDRGPLLPSIVRSDADGPIAHTWPAEAAHIARHDPARALATVVAIRSSIRALFQGLAASDGAFGDSCDENRLRYGGCSYTTADEIDRIPLLRKIAELWLGHPEHRYRWHEPGSEHGAGA